MSKGQKKKSNYNKKEMHLWEVHPTRCLLVVSLSSPAVTSTGSIKSSPTATKADRK